MDSNSYLGVSIDFQGVCVCVKYEGLRYQVDRGKRQEFEKYLGDIFWQILFVIFSPLTFCSVSF